MNKQCLNWFQHHVTKAEVLGKKVLEVGSRDVNGSVRPLFTRFAPVRYLGVDITDGPGVDVIWDAAELTDRFGLERFDIVVSTFALEHVVDPTAVLFAMARVCKPGGLLYLAVPERWPRHDYPIDGHRFTFQTLNDFVQARGDLAWEVFERQDQSASRAVVYAKLRRIPAP